MLYWTKRFSHLASISCFIAVFLLTIDYGDPYNTVRLFLGLAKGLGSAAIVWLAGFIFADIVFKGAVEDIDPERVDSLEGGLPQRVRDQRLRSGETLGTHA